MKVPWGRRLMNHGSNDEVFVVGESERVRESQLGRAADGVYRYLAGKALIKWRDEWLSWRKKMERRRVELTRRDLLNFWK